MTTWQVGQTVSWVLEIRNASGVLEDLGGGLPTATVTKPDGTTTTATVSKTATGTYRADLTSTLVGRYLCVWTGTGTNSGALPYTDSADVWSGTDPRLIISLADARAALNVAASTRTGDDELRLYIAAATDIIENLVGPRLQATKVERHTGGKHAIALYEKPTAITSVVEDGVTLAATGYCLDEAAILWRGSRPLAGYWSSSGAQNVVVTYTVGSSTIPPDVIVAARELVQHLVSTGQQSWRAPFTNALEGSVPPTTSGFAIPNRVLELLQPYMGGKLPGIA